VDRPGINQSGFIKKIKQIKYFYVKKKINNFQKIEND